MLKNKNAVGVVSLFLLSTLLSLFLPLFSGIAKADHLDPPTNVRFGPGGGTILAEHGDENAVYQPVANQPDVYRWRPSSQTSCYVEITNVNFSRNQPDTATGEFTHHTTSDPRVPCQVHETFGTITINASDINPDEDPVDGEEDFTPTCNSEGGSLAWMACPLLIGMLNAAEAMSNFMGSLLRVRPITTAADDPVFQIWQGTRNIALALLVVGALIAIFSEALSISANAYTIKKMLPRLGVVAISIMLSYYIAAIFIDFFNVLGGGMLALISSVTSELEISIDVLPALFAQFFAGFAAGGVLIAFLSPGILAGLILILLPVVLALLTALLVVTIRHVLIIALVIAAPIAFAGWLLPNTEWSFRRWYKFFGTLLMMYPIIMALLGSSIIFAYVITGGAVTSNEELNVSSVDQFVNYLLALLGIGGVMFLIPFTLKASGGVLGRIAGVVNDPNKGLFDRMRKGAQDRREYGKEARRGGRLNKLGQIEPGKGNRFRRGWLRATTGTFGYGSKYKELQESEAVTGARTPQQRQTFAELKAEDDLSRMEAFDIQKERTPTPQLLDEMKDSKTTHARKAAITEALINRRDIPELGEAFDAMAKNGQGGDVKRLAEKNIGALQEVAPQYGAGLLAGKVDETGIHPKWSQIPARTQDQIGSVHEKSVDQMLDYAGTGDNVSNLMTRYVQAKRSNDRRDAAVATKLSEIARTGRFETSDGRTVDLRSELTEKMNPEVLQEAKNLDDQYTGPAGGGFAGFSNGGGSSSGPGGAPSGGGGPSGGATTPPNTPSGGGGEGRSSSGGGEALTFEQRKQNVIRGGGIVAPEVITPDNIGTFEYLYKTGAPAATTAAGTAAGAAAGTVFWRSSVGDHPVTPTGQIHEREGKQFVEVVSNDGNTSAVPIEQVFESHESDTPVTTNRIQTLTSPPKNLVRKSPSGETTTITPIGQPFEDSGKQVVKARHDDKVIDVPVEELYPSQDSDSPVTTETINTIVSEAPAPAETPPPTSSTVVSREEGAQRLSSKPKPSIPGSEEVKNRPPDSTAANETVVEQQSPSAPQPGDEISPNAGPAVRNERNISGDFSSDVKSTPGNQAENQSSSDNPLLRERRNLEGGLDENAPPEENDNG